MGASEWTEVPLSHGFAENSRGVGVADIAHALKTGRPHRCSGELANHVLEAMHAFHISSDTKQLYTMQTHCDRPKPLPLGLPKDAVDD